VSGQLVLMQEIEKRKGSIAEVATKHLGPDKLLKYVGLAISKTPKLAECTVPSVLKCVMMASQLGLDPSGTLGSAYLVPFGRECTLIVGYRGLVDLLRRHCDAMVEARLVFRDDKFQVTYGTKPDVVHEVSMTGDRSDAAIVAAYVVFTWPDGRKSFEVMSRSEIDKVKQSSRSGSSGPWVQWYGEMAKKTVVRRGAKLQPLTVEAQEIMHEATIDDDRLDIVADVTATEPASPRKRLADQVAKQRELDEQHGVIVDEPIGMDGDGPTRVEQTAKAAEVAGKVNNTSPKADVKPATRRNARSPESLMGQQPAGPANNQTFGPTDGMDDLSALDEARDVNRE
jgi:recombination protein RecT